MIRASRLPASFFLVLAAACGPATTAPGAATSTTGAGAPAADPEPPSTVTPVLVVADVPRAAAWYADRFGGRVEAGPTRTLVVVGDAAIELVGPAPGRQPPVDGDAGGAIHVYVDDVDAVVGAATADGARVLIPADDMFWGDRFAELIDPFGHRVSVARHNEDVSDDELMRRLNLIGEAAAAGQAPPSFPPSSPSTTVITPGYHAVTPALVVRGAADALAFYRETFGLAEVSRMPLPDGRLMHAEAEVAGWRVMLSDELVDQGGLPAPREATWSFAVRVPATPASAALPREADGTFRDQWNQRWLER